MIEIGKINKRMANIHAYFKDSVNKLVSSYGGITLFHPTQIVEKFLYF
jgi:hypothetical protein